MKLSQQLIKSLCTIPNHRDKMNEAYMNFILLCLCNIFDIEEPLFILRDSKTNKKKDNGGDRREARIVFFYLSKMNTGLSYDKLVEEINRVFQIEIHKRSIQTGFEFVYKSRKIKQHNDLVIYCEKIQYRLDKYIKTWQTQQSSEEDLDQK